MQKQQFYMTLPSNSSMSLHAGNTVAEFTTTLSERVELVGAGWRVGLVEFTYPNSYYHIPKGEFIKLVLMVGSSGKLIDVFDAVPIGEGYYDSPKQLADHIVKEFTKAWEANKDTISKDMISDTTRPMITISYVEKTNKLKVQSRRLGFALQLSPLLADILALRKLAPPKRDTIAQEYVSESEVDLLRGLHTLYIYCDIIEDTLVGDTKAPLLRSTTLQGVRGSMTKETYVKPYYHPLKTLSFDTIQCNIKASTGQLAPFNAGQSSLTLHFKRDALA